MSWLPCLVALSTVLEQVGYSLNIWRMTLTTAVTAGWIFVCSIPACEAARTSGSSASSASWKWGDGPGLDGLVRVAAEDPTAWRRGPTRGSPARNWSLEVLDHITIVVEAQREALRADPVELDPPAALHASRTFLFTILARTFLGVLGATSLAARAAVAQGGPMPFSSHAKTRPQALRVTPAAWTGCCRRAAALGGLMLAKYTSSWDGRPPGGQATPPNARSGCGGVMTAAGEATADARCGVPPPYLGGEAAACTPGPLILPGGGRGQRCHVGPSIGPLEVVCTSPLLPQLQNHLRCARCAVMRARWTV